MTLITAPTGAPTTIVYDANGNTTLQNTGGSLTTFTWDAENRLISRSDPANGILTSTYDAIGQRAELVTPSATTLFVRDGQNILIEANSSGVTQAHYIDGRGLWGNLTSQRRSSTSSFYGSDMSSNSRILTSSTAGELATYLTDAFGLEKSITGSTANPFVFDGMDGLYRDSTNWIHARGRFLDTVKGRWPSRDTDSLDGGRWDDVSHSVSSIIGLDINPYQFAYNNPVIFVDLDGARPKKRSHAGNKILPCPLSRPTDLATSEYAIACSKHYVSSISADFTLPSLCNVKDGYINFYLSMGGFEAGVSFGDQFKTWKSFFNVQGHEQHLTISLSPGQTVSMSLARQASGFVEFTINGMSLTSQSKLTKLDQARAVTGVSYDTCLQAHSIAIWSNISVPAGMNPRPWTYGAEQIKSNLLASTFRNPTSPCDSSQYS